MKMKKTFLTLALIVQVDIVLFCQQTGDEFSIHHGENVFSLLMPISDVYKMLGEPIEVQRIKSNRPYHGYDIVILRYPDISFRYFDHDFFGVPVVIMIESKGRDKKLGKLDVFGLNKDEIIQRYGEPELIGTENEYTFFLYSFRLHIPHYLSLS